MLPESEEDRSTNAYLIKLASDYESLIYFF